MGTQNDDKSNKINIGNKRLTLLYHKINNLWMISANCFLKQFSIIKYFTFQCKG